MQEDDATSNASEEATSEAVQHVDISLEYQREVLRYITEIGSSLRLQMDADTLLKRVSEATCKALRFRYSVLYLTDGMGYFRACATWGVSPQEEEYHRSRPLPEAVVVRLINEDYRMSDSYFIPAEAPIWQNGYIASFFVVDDVASLNLDLPKRRDSPEVYWNPEDMLLVPLISGNNMLLGFLNPDSPLDGLRPTRETLMFLELFANQAAVVIEGVRLYEEARQSNEERKALIEIGRALSAPDALRDLQTVYATIYEQVRRVMPTDVFFVIRYYRSQERLVIVYLVNAGQVDAALEYPVSLSPARQVLLQDTRGRIFSTAREYAQFAEENFAELSDMLGNKQVAHSLLIVPISYAGESIGLLSAQSYYPHAYTQRHLEMLKEIGVQAGIAITNARLNTALRDALKQAQESERLKNHFLMTASHELRTPLTAIQGYLELLNNFGTVLDAEAKGRFINNARRACEELVLLLGNVMDTSHIDQEHLAFHLRPVQVCKAVQMILEILEPTIAREGRQVQVSIGEDVMVWVDDLRLRQILLNIVSNALKYTPAPTNLAIGAERVDAEKLAASIQHRTTSIPPGANPDPGMYVVVAIRDWGPGIGPEDQARLFTKFMRLDSAINSLQRGAGLGLYLCRQLVEAMGGYIWVESAGVAGEGSTFFIALPSAAGL